MLLVSSENQFQPNIGYVNICWLFLAYSNLWVSFNFCYFKNFRKHHENVITNTPTALKLISINFSFVLKFAGILVKMIESIFNTIFSINDNNKNYLQNNVFKIWFVFLKVLQKYDHDKQTMNNQCKNKLPCRKLNVQKKQLKTCFTQIYRVKEGDEIYNYLPCPSFDDLLSFRLMHKRREVNDDQHSPCTVLFV